jgi:membrane-associated phospholipid phosphatase
MRLRPTSIDIWCVQHLAQLLGKHETVDLGIQSLISHNVFGGFWFALLLFVLWVWPSQAGEAAELEKQRTLLVILLGSLVAVAIALLLGASMSWLPPNRMPGLAQLYPNYLDANTNDNSFPSLSVALYASIAAGITSFRKGLGLFLWPAVALFVALPRMYVGGHYLTDIIAGLGAGFLGFAIASFAARNSPNVWRRTPEQTSFIKLATNVVVFGWILQVAVEFRDATWLVRGCELVLRRFL